MRKPSRDARTAALEVIHALRDAGHVALLAGGCVRDMLLKRTPKDYDVVTDATPARVHALFPRARKVGAQFGVMLVRRYGHDVEVATFRSEGTYSDGRHPDEIRFGTEVEDAARRDFTINGLFYDPVAERVIDHVGGTADIEAGVVRTIGVPEQRFAEDHLRMLRAVRFAATLGFAIAPTTMDAIRRHAPKLRAISVERIWQELEQILTDPSRARGWGLLIEVGLRPHLVSQWEPLTGEDWSVPRRLAALPDGVISGTLGLAAAVSARGPTQAKKIARTLRLSNREIQEIVWLVASLPQARAADTLELADLKLLRSQPGWDDLVALLAADLKAKEADAGPCRELCRRAAAIAPEAVNPPPLLSGHDLAALGLSEGPTVGPILGHLRRAQLNEEIRDRAEAECLARRLIRGVVGGASQSRE
ncbi:MAG TPA: CCA tRNA nucleotidyltransferase [Phycisphaerae bacterium]|nr:CCA tRNA nucleotidyltransferase [Phycisphaerae bacterium]HNU44580.1 CCA tRNA nucleotidyltransferase [Phycisphaerae bacterium]